jgi:peptidoglycan hydrolase-like protein with peptidoglycan-binding domain
MAVALGRSRAKAGACCAACRGGGRCASGKGPSPGGPTRDDEILQLQRLAGNAAVSSHIAGRRPRVTVGSGAHAALQRLTAAERQEDLASERYAGDARLEATFDNAPPMRVGERGRPVALVQQGLSEDGFTLDGSIKPNGSFDGIFGNETLTAVHGFQQKHELGDAKGMTDGIVGRRTLGRLDQLAKGGGGKPKPKPPAACADGAVNLDPDPIPQVPAPSIKTVPGDDMLAELRKRSGGNLPRDPPLGATTGKVSQVVPITTRTAPDAAGGACVKCVAEWPLPLVAIEVLIATGFVTNEKRFWVTQPGDNGDCPQPFPKLKDVRALITSGVLPKILVAELEHVADIRRAFQLAMHRWGANVGRLSEARTHLRGLDDADCKRKVEAFLNAQSDLPIGIPLDKMPFGLFMDDFESLRQGSDTRDESAHKARAFPPRDRPPVRPSFDLARNPFGCDAFFRKYDARSAPGVPGPPSDQVVKEIDGPPRRRWHSM